MSQVIILRPEPAASRTAEKARALGVEASVRPLFVPEAVAWAPPPSHVFDALLLTSANGVRMAGAALGQYRSLPAYAVGDATALALTQAGFANVVAGQSDGSSIARRIAADGHVRVLHLSGIAVAAMDAGPLAITRIAVYHMAALPRDGDWVDDVSPGAVLLVHSARAGEQLAMQMGEHRRTAIHIVAISAAAAAACATGWASVQHPPRPRDDDMLALARRLCE